MTAFFIGVDVGTGSARAGVFDGRGTLLSAAKEDLRIWRTDDGRVEQSSAQIWAAVCAAVRRARERAAVAPTDVAGIGFDATCSMVVQGEAGGLPVGDAGRPDRDVIVWMDHRATKQAQRINAGDHNVLRYVGGRISPEMQIPKLLWLKEHRAEVFEAARHFFDLTDFLTWKASGDTARSACTVTCKWTYLAHEDRWDAGFFRDIGLGQLEDEAFVRIGRSIRTPGSALGQGLTGPAARDLGLRPGTAVAAGLIDAHAGGIGTVAAAGRPERCLGYVFGTSSCTMTTTSEPAFVPGIWGPYFSAMVPGKWLNEGGQSVAGAAMEHLVKLHPAAAEVATRAGIDGISVPQWLADRALERVEGPSHAVRLAEALHVVPEFMGNRAPFADPEARAVVLGLGLEDGVDALVALYVAGLCGLGYGLRQIIEAQAAHGVTIDVISVSGGAGAHTLSRQILSDATGYPVVVTENPEPVLLGSAMLASVASGQFDGVGAAMPAMSRVAMRCSPASGALRQLHDARYGAFRTLQDTARNIRTDMKQSQ